MVKPSYNYKPNETTKFFDKLNTVLYLLGLPNFWIEDVKLPKRFVKIYDAISIIIHVMTILFSLMLIGSFITQKNLTDKQQSDLNVFSISNPWTVTYIFVYWYYRDESREVLYYLAVILKEDHNDEEIEKNLIKRLRIYFIGYTCVSIPCLGYYGLSGLVQVIHSDGPFITVITAWPDVTDTSKLAAKARIGFYIFWCINFFRISAAFIILLSMLIGLNYQYKNLKNYFESLNNIFNEIHLRHDEQEANFLKAFTKGIKMHSDTIWCTRQCQLISGYIFNSIVILVAGLLVVIMPAIMNSKNDSKEMCAHLTILSITLIILGLVMWNSGDITVEASKLPNAIYGSGWYNCYNKNSVRVRSLLVMAMAQAQQPIVLTALKIVELSYETYVAIIKSAYSVFSVFY